MRQPTYKQMFRVGDVVEVAQAPLDGELQPQWLRGEVIKITTRLHVSHGGDRHMAYDRAMYNRGEIRRGEIRRGEKIEALVARAKALRPEHLDGLAEHLAPLFASPLGAEQMLRFAAKHHPEGAATALAVSERWCVSKSTS